jgi:hypothetical protein
MNGQIPVVAADIGDPIPLVNIITTSQQSLGNGKLHRILLRKKAIPADGMA